MQLPSHDTCETNQATACYSRLRLQMAGNLPPQKVSAQPNTWGDWCLSVQLPTAQFSGTGLLLGSCWVELPCSGLQVPQAM